MLARISSRALGLAVVALCMSLPARAQEVEFGTAVFCNTQQQMERFVALFDGDDEAAINAVNAEENDPNACGNRTIAYIRGPEVATATTSTWAFHIVRVLVVGVLTESGFKPAVPMAFFSFEQVEERTA